MNVQFLIKPNLIFLFCLLTISLSAQHPSATLDLESTTQGVLVPRMTTAQRTMVNAPATGLLVFDTTSKSFWFFDGSNWVDLTQDADADPMNEIQSLSLDGAELSLSGANTINLPGYEQEEGDNPMVFNIADNPILDASSPIMLSSGGVISSETEIKVCVDVYYDYLYELELKLIAPDGSTGIVLTKYKAIQGSGNFTNTCFTTDATVGISSGTVPYTGNFTPNNAFSSLIGQSISGVWTLEVKDSNLGNNDTGTLNSWSIEFFNKDNSNFIADTDQDTKIEVEAGADLDEVLITINGDEKIKFLENASNELMMNVGNPLSRNIFIGQNAGLLNASSAIFGVDNTFLGYHAGATNSTGYGNTFVGSNSGKSVNTGIQNSFFGAQAGQNNDGEGNVFIGNDSGNSNTAGDGNLFLGNKSGFSETGSNKLYITNTDSDKNNALIYGEFDNTDLKLNADVSIKNKLSLSAEGVAFSDGDLIDKGTICKYYMATVGVYPSNGGGSSPDTYLGEIRLFPYSFTPGGWIECKGQLLDISSNAALFSLIGTTYGGNGMTNFAVPDFRNAVPVHN